jgi:amino acid adenylation domain-containing protein
MLSDSQREKLAARLRKGRAQTATGIPRRDPALVDLPLSAGQEQLWFIDQFAPGLATYNIAGTIRITGELAVPALATALDRLVQRHEALRTRLVSTDGQPWQVIDQAPVTVFDVRDLSALPDADRDERFRHLCATFGHAPFDLAKGPLLKTELVRLAEREHALLVCVHHSVFDGWSFEVMLRELAELYDAATTGRADRLPELPIQFADYAVWEQERLRGPAMAELVGYWEENLRGVGSVQMPTDRPRPVVQSFDGGLERLDMGAETLQGLRALARREGTTIFVTLLAALQVLLHRYSGQDDLVVGTASANRSRPELAPLIGYLVNTLPIRTDASGDPTFLELLGRVKDTTVAAQAHQDLPFPKLIEALRVERDASRAPLVQIGFTIGEEPGRTLSAGDTRMRLEPIEGLAAKFDLNFFMQAHDDFTVELSYATALFDPATAQRMLRSLRELTAGIVRDPQARLSQLPVLTEEDLYRELVEWNSNIDPYPVVCLHELVQAQAARVPEAVAAVYEGTRMTYRELNAAANRAARHLRERGVGPERLVGVHMQPSIDRLVGILGVLKAGGAYVPLDPEYPPDRLSFMLSDAAVSVVLSDPAGEAGMRELGADVVVAERVWPTLTGLSGEDLDDTGVTPANAAYAIYTSGSTGKPKGVVVEHRQVVNFMQGMVAHFPLTEDDRFLQFASLNFDVSVMDMFLALCSGGTAVFGSRQTLLSPPQLAELMRAERVTFACLPPAVLNLLTGEEFPDQRVLISAGEELSTELVRKWLRPGLRVHNGYGPTEVTIGATMMELDADNITPPPIGLPKPNYRAYVLDTHLNPVPVGVAGELHLGGPGVARGYLNRPELTAEKFIDDPFSDEPGARMYKTGDLVRRRPDGNIVFLGRIDGQVKIRGLRIELGEIETAIASHPEVAQSVVVVGEDAAGEKQLVGYARLVPGGAGVSVADLRQHLAQRLPSYMVPTHIMLLDEFPLNPSGKIDRGRLPAPDLSQGGGNHVAPRTLVETMLVDAYATLLNSERVSVEDSFFDLGGNSLLAMRLITRLRDDLAVDADVTAVFLAPTPSQLAALLRERYDLEDVELGEEGIEGLDDLVEASGEAGTPAGA